MEDLDHANFITSYIGNIKKITESNKSYRKVIATTPNSQLVVMSLKPKEDIDMEIHPYNTQIIRIEKGTGYAVIGDNEYILEEGSLVIVPLNTKHYIANTSNRQFLKLNTIYSPPNHPDNHEDILKPVNDRY
jgi:mannose-6-phosphate isomerase-like protein (cupin superfamily)